MGITTWRVKTMILHWKSTNLLALVPFGISFYSLPTSTCSSRDDRRWEGDGVVDHVYVPVVLPSGIYLGQVLWNILHWDLVANHVNTMCNWKCFCLHLLLVRTEGFIYLAVKLLPLPPHHSTDGKISVMGHLFASLELGDWVNKTKKNQELKTSISPY